MTNEPPRNPPIWGITLVTIAQIAATEMGIAVEDVSVVMGDTAVVPYDQQTSASRSTVFMGNAIMRACRDIQDQVRVMAAAQDGVPQDQVAVEEGIVSLPTRDVPIIEVVMMGHETLWNAMTDKEAILEKADTDFDGDLRPQGGGSDQGADEYCAAGNGACAPLALKSRQTVSGETLTEGIVD